jgi:plastocyanin
MGASVSLTAAEFAFDPSELSVAAGGTIAFTNADDVEHNFTVEDAGIDDDLDAGGSTTIDLSAVEAGTYDFFCEYHPDTMTGTLEVTG